MNLMDRNVDRFSEARFTSPAIHTAFAGVIDQNDPSGMPRTYRFNITHFITPETNHSIHYWWFNTRDQYLDDVAADDFLRRASEQAYLEDVDALEWIANVIQKDVQPQFDLNFAPDKPTLLMRRVLFNLAEAERRGA